jgi:hypothetical protein
LGHDLIVVLAKNFFKAYAEHAPLAPTKPAFPTVSILLRAKGILKLGLQEILVSKQRFEARPSQDFWIYFKNH